MTKKKWKGDFKKPKTVHMGDLHGLCDLRFEGLGIVSLLSAFFWWELSCPRIAPCSIPACALTETSNENTKINTECRPRSTNRENQTISESNRFFFLLLIQEVLKTKTL